MNVGSCTKISKRQSEGTKDVARKISIMINKVNKRTQREVSSKLNVYTGAVNREIRQILLRNIQGLRAQHCSDYQNDVNTPRSSTEKNVNL